MTDKSTYKFYAMDHSYYSGKVRPYLRYKGIPYEEIVSTLWVYKTVIIPETGVRFIPVLQSPDGVFVQDTTDIIDFLEERFPDRPIYPSTPKQRLTALLFELFADEWLLFPAMHYRWSYVAHHEKWLMGEFGRIVGKWAPAPVRRAAGRKLSKPFQGFLPVLGISDETAPGIEASYLEFLALLEAHLSKYSYLLGSRPSMGDFALAGPLYAHLWLDPYPKAIMEREAPNVVAWIQRINAEDQPQGSFLPIDEVPETVLPMLAFIFREQFPILLDTVEKVATWVDDHPEKEYVSRGIGKHDFKVGGVAGTRLVFPYSQWMLQRPVEYYHGLNESQKEDVNALLNQVGGSEAMQVDIKKRLVRRNNRIAVDA